MGEKCVGWLLLRVVVIRQQQLVVVVAVNPAMLHTSREQSGSTNHDSQTQQHYCLSLNLSHTRALPFINNTRSNATYCKCRFI